MCILERMVRYVLVLQKVNYIHLCKSLSSRNFEMYNELDQQKSYQVRSVQQIAEKMVKCLPMS